MNKKKWTKVEYTGNCWHDMGYYTISAEVCLMGDHYRNLGDPEDLWYEMYTTEYKESEAR